MKCLLMPVLALAAASLAHAQAPGGSKVGVISIQGAIVGTKDGQKAAAELDSKRAPRRKKLEQQQADITGLQEKLRKASSGAVSETVRLDLTREIDTKTKSFNRDMEDAQAEDEQEQAKALQDLSGRMMLIIEKYAKENGYVLVMDVSSPQTPVLFASNSIDITQEIIKLYDASAPAPGAAPAAGTAAKPAVPPAKPAVAPPAKKP